MVNRNRCQRRRSFVIPEKPHQCYIGNDPLSSVLNTNTKPVIFLFISARIEKNQQYTKIDINTATSRF